MLKKYFVLFYSVIVCFEFVEIPFYTLWNIFAHVNPASQSTAVYKGYSITFPQYDITR